MADKFLKISDFILDFKAHNRHHQPPNTNDIKTQAANLALATLGPEGCMQMPSSVNLSALSLLMSRVVVHEISPGAGRRIEEIDLHNLPGEPPRLLKAPFIVETRRPDRGEVIFGETVCLAGYPLDESIYLIGFQVPDGAIVHNWKPRWQAKELAAGLPQEGDSELFSIGDREGYYEWGQRAARWAILLGLLLDAEGLLPVRVGAEVPVGGADSKKKGKKGKKKKKLAEGIIDWAVRRISLFDPQGKRAEVTGAGSGGDVGGLGAGGPGYTESRVASATVVRGHLKRQVYGPGLSLRKWVYVDSYEARRWVAPKPLRVVVK